MQTLTPTTTPLTTVSGRRDLRRQIARLEAELAAYAPTSGDGLGGARLLDLGELERVRDDLVDRLAAARAATLDHARARALLERMVAAPFEHRGTRLRLADVGEPGCGTYVVRLRPRLSLRLRDWWVVRLSSGCP